jgi:hypothetical protein
VQSGERTEDWQLLLLSQFSFIFSIGINAIGFDLISIDSDSTESDNFYVVGTAELDIRLQCVLITIEIYTSKLISRKTCMMLVCLSKTEWFLRFLTQTDENLYLCGCGFSHPGFHTTSVNMKDTSVIVAAM